jgi:hypothetical protein
MLVVGAKNNNGSGQRMEASTKPWKHGYCGEDSDSLQLIHEGFVLRGGEAIRRRNEVPVYLKDTKSTLTRMMASMVKKHSRVDSQADIQSMSFHCRSSKL